MRSHLLTSVAAGERLGVKAAAKYDGVEYWLSDWQGEEMTAPSTASTPSSAYKQEYCGCSYSLRDSNHWCSKQSGRGTAS